MSEVKRVDAAEAKRLIDEEGYAYLDVRSVPEWGGGHAVGAKNVPLMHAGAGGMKPNPDFMKVMEAVFDKGDKLVVACASGKRSARAAALLQEAGFTQLVDLKTGYNGLKNAFGQVQDPGWATAGYPTETATEGASWDELAARAKG